MQEPHGKHLKHRNSIEKYFRKVMTEIGKLFQQTTSNFGLRLELCNSKLCDTFIS